MKRVFIKSTLYIIFVTITLEVFDRVFHLYSEAPLRYIYKFRFWKNHVRELVASEISDYL